MTARSERIAKASLCVYPCADAYEILVNGYDSKKGLLGSEREPTLRCGKLVFVSSQTESGSSWKLKVYLPANVRLYHHENFLEKVFSTDCGKDAWMNNFAKLALASRSHWLANAKWEKLANILQDFDGVLYGTWHKELESLCKHKFNNSSIGIDEKTGLPDFGWRRMYITPIDIYNDFNSNNPNVDWGEGLNFVFTELAELAKNFKARTGSRFQDAGMAKKTPYPSERFLLELNENLAVAVNPQHAKTDLELYGVQYQ